MFGIPKNVFCYTSSSGVVPKSEVVKCAVMKKHVLQLSRHEFFVGKLTKMSNTNTNTLVPLGNLPY